MNRAKGFTFVEMMITITLLTLVLGVVFQTLLTSQNFFQSQISKNSLQEAALVVSKEIGEHLREAPFGSINTAQQNTKDATIYNYFNHFLDSSGNFKQCNNANTCPWSNNTLEMYNIAFTYGKTQAGLQSVTRGKVSPPTRDNRCSECNSPLLNDAYIDGVLLASYKDQAGAISSTNPAPWEALIFYFPYWAGANYQLRRYTFYRTNSDIGGPNLPDLKSLLDFDNNDEISMDPASPEPGLEEEIFEIMNDGRIHYRRYNGTSTRIFDLKINRDSGATEYNIDDNDTVNVTGTVNRPPKIIAPYLIGMDISTKLSSLYNAANNPRGIASTHTVRVTLSLAALTSGSQRRQINHVQTFEVFTHPRNK